ncbi:hypothetical protein ACFRFH_12040 [Leifsonia sp. NPDC056824]|uniref:hypothetical protein n=1 Tax=Leifsonia sp. NPDC056824 TaxID=3345953 RepID=UPI0036896BE4
MKEMQDKYVAATRSDDSAEWFAESITELVKDWRIDLETLTIQPWPEETDGTRFAWHLSFRGERRARMALK